jgi:hypothetical protein
LAAAYLIAAAPFPPRFRTVDQPAGMSPVPAAMPDRVVRAPEARVVVTGREPYAAREVGVTEQLTAQASIVEQILDHETANP